MLQHSLQYSIHRDVHANLKHARLSTRMARTGSSVNYSVLFCLQCFGTKLTQLSLYHHFFIITIFLMQDSTVYRYVRNSHRHLSVQL